MNTGTSKLGVVVLLTMLVLALAYIGGSHVVAYAISSDHPTITEKTVLPQELITKAQTKHIVVTDNQVRNSISVKHEAADRATLKRVSIPGMTPQILATGAAINTPLTCRLANPGDCPLLF